MVPFAAERSRWLAELAQAIDEAQYLVHEVGGAAGGSAVVLDLSARLAVVRAELDSIRRGCRIADTPPEWTKFPRSKIFEPAGG
jgi:hypothetical protein